MWKPPRGRGRRKNVVDFEIASSVFELEARWVANNFDPPAVINLLKDSCMAAANRPATRSLLPALLSKANL